MKFPKTWFSTPLSGSARAAEGRIRNVFQKNKKRPPLWLMSLCAAACLLCGSLVSCQARAAQPEEGAPQPAPAASLPAEPAGEPADLLRREGDREILDSLLPREALDALGGSVTRTVLDEQFLLDGLEIAACAAYDGYPRFRFALGVTDQATGEARAPVFTASCSGRMPQVTCFTWQDKECVLYVLNSMSQGFSFGEAGVVSFDGERLNWEWPVEGDVLDETSQAHADYQAYWEHRLALTAPGGVDVFTENEDFGPYPGSPVQWTLENGYFFYPSETDTLPIGVYYQVRAWLEEFTRDGHNPYQAVNTSALWSVCSLMKLEPFGLEGEQRLYLLARSDGLTPQYFSAYLTMVPGESVRADAFAVGSWEEVCALSDPADQGKTPEEHLKSVLLGESTFLSERGLTTLEQFTRTVYGGMDRGQSRFTLVDLDGDGALEAAVQLGADLSNVTSYEILHWHNGTVYGYERGLRSFNVLKTDGTFVFSSGAADGGVGKLSFEGAQCAERELLRHMPGGAGWEDMVYLADGNAVTKAEYDAASAREDQKPEAVWYDLTPENISRLFS